MTLASNGLANAIPFRWTYADATARGAASGFTSADLYSLALQLDNASVWILTATTPTWVAAAGSGMLNPMTTAGDLILGGSSGTPGRLAKGSDGTVLTIDATTHLPVWAAAAGGGDAVVVDEVALAADASSVRFPASGSLATGYAAWKLIINGRGSAAVSDAVLSLQFNGDTGTNYDWVRHRANTSSHDVAATRSTNAIGAGAIPGASATSGRAGVTEITIGDPEGVTYHKPVVGVSSDFDGSAADSDVNVWQYSGIWKNTAAITSITVTTGLKAGSRLTLVGIKKLAGGARTS